jgi:hypothetical protein
MYASQSWMGAKILRKKREEKNGTNTRESGQRPCGVRERRGMLRCPLHIPISKHPGALFFELFPFILLLNPLFHE